MVITPPQGCLARAVVLLSGTYVLGMVTYLVLRLLFGASTWWLALLNAFAIYTFAPLLLLLPLALLLRLWPTFARLGLLGLLAAIWFGPFFQPVTIPDPGDATQIKVVTFNMFANNNNQAQDAIDWLLSTDADLIFIQEAPDLLLQGETALQAAYSHRIAPGSRRLILSRYPLQADTPWRALMTVDEVQIALYNIHYSFPFRDEARFPLLEDLPLVGRVLGTFTRYDESQRNADVERLLGRLADETLPHIVAGDFNLSQHSLMYSDLALVLQDSFRETNSGLGATWPAEFPTLRLDYVWLSEDLLPVDSDLGPRNGSDHLPLIATVAIPAQDGEAVIDD